MLFDVFISYAHQDKAAADAACAAHALTPPLEKHLKQLVASVKGFCQASGRANTQKKTGPVPLSITLTVLTSKWKALQKQAPRDLFSQKS